MTFAEITPVLAQAGGGAFGGGGGGGGGDEAFAIIMIVVYVIAIAASLAISILYYLTLSRALKECDSRNRTMEPGMVWLNLIPCFGLVWIFITVSRIAESLSNEFRERGLRSDGDFGRGIGITTYILFICSIIPFVGSVIAIGGLVCWILYWVKISGYVKQLREGESFRDEEDGEYRRRYEDDRPSKRRRDDDYEDDDVDDRPSKRRRRDDDDDYDD